jgi:hypothetical protein
MVETFVGESIGRSVVGRQVFRVFRDLPNQPTAQLSTSTKEVSRKLEAAQSSIKIQLSQRRLS